MNLFNLVIFLVAKICHFSIFLKKSQAIWWRELFRKIQKNHHNFRKKVWKSPRFLRDLGKFVAFLFLISSFLANRSCQHGIRFLNFLLLYLSCSQFWLNPLVADGHFWRSMERIEGNKQNNASDHIPKSLVRRSKT
jgi:hypothetical protein